MIKLVIFDMDGVLVDAKEIHYESLNKALEEVDPKYIINREEHLKIYDGLPTKKKLEILSQNKNLPKDLHSKISTLKQQYTVSCIKDHLSYDDRLVSVLKKLKENGFKIYVASNAVRESVKLMLLKTGLLEYVDYFLANEDAQLNKPHPEIYLRAMIHAGAKPNETVIVEDSVHGREAAVSSGAYLCGVDRTEDVTFERIIQVVNDAKDSIKGVWFDNSLNVLIPMAGPSDDFYKAGYSVPKYLIDIKGKIMIQRVIESLKIKANYTFIIKEEDCKKYNTDKILKILVPNCNVVITNVPNDGIVCSTLLAKNIINNDNHLVIAHDDAILDYDAAHFIYTMINNKCDAGIVTSYNNNPKFSYSKLNEDGLVDEVYEKRVISNNANAGVYFINKGSDYVKFGEQLISKNIRVNNWFYDSMVLNEMAQSNKKVKIYNADKVVCLGYPSDVDNYLSSV